MTRTRKRIGALSGRCGDSGTAAIEFALMTPFLLVLLGGSTEVGLVVYEKMQVNAAVEAGIFDAVVKGWDPDSITSAVTGFSLLPAQYALTATPPPAVFCGCPAAGSVSNLGLPPCSATACGGTPAGIQFLL